MDTVNFPEAADGKRSPVKRFFAFAVPILLVLLAGGVVLVYFLGELKLKQAAERATLEKQRYERVFDERSVAIQRSDIRLFAVPLAWSVRRELMRENYGQIDDYFNELVRKKQFGALMLLDSTGTVKVATDRKILGSAFSALYPGLDAGTGQIVSYPLSEGSSLFLVPVMGLNARIGTIAFVYSYQQISIP